MIARPHFSGDKRSLLHPSRQPSLARVYGILLLTFVGLAIWLALDLQQEYKRILADTLQRATQRSQIIGQSLHTQVLASDYVLRDVLGRINEKDLAYPDPGTDHAQQMARLLKEKADTVPDFFSMVIFNRDCVFTATANGKNIGVKSKAELCEARKRHQGPGPLVNYVPGSKSASGRSVIVLSRHLMSPAGDFQGGVLGVIELERAQQWFDRLNLGKGESVALFDDTSALLARHPASPEMLEKRTFFLNLSGPLPSSDSAIQSDVDGQKRIFGFSQLEGFPLKIVYGFDKAIIIKAWQRRTVELTVGYCILLFLALWGVRSHWTTLLQREELRASKEHFHTLFESTSDAVMVLDKHDILECNGAALNVFGHYSKEDFLKLSSTDLSPPNQPSGDDSTRLMAENFDKTFQQHKNRFDWVYKRLDSGQTFPAEVLLSPIQIHGQDAIVAVVRDITERKAMQLELERRVLARTEELATARAEAESANAVKTRFMTNVSHEMRTPMNGILGFAEIGKKKATKNAAELYANYFDKILISGKRLYELIESLLKLAEAVWDEQSGDAKNDWKEVNMDILLAQCISMLEKTALGRQQTIELQCSTATPIILGDEPRLRQMLHHLIGNALRYSPDGSQVTVLMLDETDTSKRSHMLKIQVIDQGCGIPEKELGAIFEPFYESTRTATGAGGSGLGLALSTNIIRRHQGRITAANKPEGGAIFEILLPNAFH